jgi:hypothetical protein
MALHNQVLLNAALAGFVTGALQASKIVDPTAGDYAALVAQGVPFATQVDAAIPNDTEISGVAGVTLPPTTSDIQLAQISQSLLVEGLSEATRFGQYQAPATPEAQAGFTTAAAAIAALYAETVASFLINEGGAASGKNNDLLFNCALAGFVCGAVQTRNLKDATAGDYAALVAQGVLFAIEVDLAIPTDGGISGGTNVSDALVPSTPTITDAAYSQTSLLFGLCKAVRFAQYQAPAVPEASAGYAVQAAAIAAIYTQTVASQAVA